VSSRLVNFQWIVLAVLSAALVTAQVSHAAPAAASQEQIAPYSIPQQLVHIEKGRTINLVCLGRGSPTVILTAGLGEWSLTWRLVQRQLAKRTRVCAWDRAGYGFSSPSQEPQDTVHITADLERALKSADIRGPYMMVGHSLGAYEALRFTDLHRQSVVGMVLVDPAIPDQRALMERIAPLFRTKSSALDGQVVQRLRDCAAELQGGTLKRGTPDFEQCTAAPVVPADFPRLKVAIARLNAEPARLLTQASTVTEFDSDAARDSREVMNVQRRYGDMPLIVLTAGRDGSQMLQMFGDGTPAEVAQLREQVAQYLQDVWVPAHDAYAALSTRGRNQLVPDSGHGIQREKPDVVISAVIEALDEIRSSALHEQ
jgi:pimeloyl-ACP methyl ester carboxylesterase